MSKSVAILLLIIAFAGAEDHQAAQTSYTEGAAKENVSDGGKTTPTIARDLHTQQHQLDDTHESVPDKKDQAGVEAEKEDHGSNKEREAMETKIDEKTKSMSDKKDQAGVEAKKDHVSNEEREEMETKIDEKTGEEETQAGQEGFTFISTDDTDDSDEENENVNSAKSSSAATGSTQAQQHDVFLYESSEETKKLKKEIKDDTELYRGSWQVSTHCLDCLCRTTSRCDLTTLEKGCSGGTCGPFGISYVFWEDAFDHKLPDGPSFEDDKEEVSMQCLDCLCTFATNCDMERQCEKPISTIGLDEGFDRGDCGPFHISFPFWADANRVTLKLGDAKMENEWRLCSLDLMCSKDAIQKYFRKYHHDCNGDGKVDCIDYAAIHTLGPFGCMVRSKLISWNVNRRKRLVQCLASKEKGPYARKMEELNAKLKLQDISAWKLAEIEKKRSEIAEAKLQTNAVNSEDKMNAKEVEAHDEMQRAIIHV